MRRLRILWAALFAATATAAAIAAPTCTSCFMNRVGISGAVGNRIHQVRSSRQ
jgi:hypothetical protein